jgi:ATP-dependent helicase HrpB
MTQLPIFAVLDDLRSALAHNPRVLLQAPPGAGKSTQSPLALLDAPWLAGKQIWLLEPRRLAAANVARQLAENLGEKLGERIGLLTRHDKHIGPNNKILVMTEGLLSRRLLENQEIPECGLIIFDECHERHLQTDLGLALACQCQELLREDLKILLMSATLDERWAETFDAAKVTSAGRQYPIVYRYLGRNHNERLDDAMATALRSICSEQNGHILVFLPGVPEIRRLQNRLTDMYGDNSGKRILPLHGQLTPAEQQAALAPCAEQKIILATAVAQTSLTIDGISAVLDSGLERYAALNPRTGLDELVTRSVSRATAEQRAGRAGRTAAGTCYRLWSQESEASFAPQPPAEIETVDLSALALALASWGDCNLDEYRWLTPPHAMRWQQSIELLHQLDALHDMRITQDGEAMARLPLHPRLAHMLIRGQADNQATTACAIAALLEEGDPIRSEHPDTRLANRLHLLEGGRDANVSQGALQRLKTSFQRLKGLLNASGSINSDACGELLLFAYPDRLAQKRGEGYRLRNGRGITVRDHDANGRHEFLVLAQTFNNDALRLAAPISLERIRQLLQNQIAHNIHVHDKNGQLQAREQEQLGALVLSEKHIPLKPEYIRDHWCQVLRNEGLQRLPWPESSANLLKRLQLFSAHHSAVPSFAEADLLTDLATWLAPFIERNLEHIPLNQALMSRLPWELHASFKQQLPEFFSLPSGRDAAIDYCGDLPVVEAKLQECFGLLHSPKLLNNSLPLRISMLSPSKVPLAISTDLDHFWRNVYPDVRKENRGRYNKHPWPEDPFSAEATSKTNRQLRNE